jgi:hypothetical protein
VLGERLLGSDQQHDRRLDRGEIRDLAAIRLRDHRGDAGGEGRAVVGQPAGPGVVGKRTVASLVARDEAFHPALEIRGPSGHLGGLIACSGEGAVPGDDQCADAVGMMTTECQRDIAAHGVAPEARRCNLQIVQHGDDVGGLPASPICRLIVRLVAPAVSASVDEDEAIGVGKPRDVPSVPPVLSRPGQAVVEHQRLPAPRDLVVDTRAIVHRVRHRAVPLSW